MKLIRMDKARESAPVVLNVIKDSGWCYAYGIISVVAIVPVITFQAYEIWKCRKDGWHKISLQLTGMIALLGNGSWMISDIFFHDQYRTYSKWIFGISWVFVALFGVFSYRASKTGQKEEEKPARMMTISKETRGIVFLHGRVAHLRRPLPRGHYRTITARSRAPRQS